MSFARAINSRDLGAAVEHWTPDAALIAPDGSEVRGSNEILERLKALIASNTTIEIEVESTIETAHLALGATKMTIVPSGASEQPVEFKGTVVYKRGQDGWRIAIDALSTA